VIVWSLAQRRTAKGKLLKLLKYWERTPTRKSPPSSHIDVGDTPEVQITIIAYVSI
jgi:hypothetical protein